MAKAGTVWVDVRADTSGFARDLSRATDGAARSLGGLVSSGAKTFFSDLGTAAGVASVAVGGIGAAALKASTDFNQAVSGVAAVAGATAAEMDALREAALAAGAATAFSASEAAVAEAELARAGVSVADILGGALTGSLDLAAAGQLELGQAAEISAQALNIFGLAGDQTTRVADVLAAGANKSAADVKQLGDALRQGGLVAAQMGLDLETTIGALSLFADNALIGSDAGTSFKTMLQRLAPTSDEAAELMEALGLKFFDAQGQFVGLEEVARQLKTQLGDLSDEQRAHALTTIFGSDAVRAATLLMDAGAEGVREYTAAVSDQGAAARMAATQLDNLAGDVEEFSGATETALIRVGDLFQGFARGVVQGGTEVVNAFNDFATTPAWTRIEANVSRLGDGLQVTLGGIGERISDAFASIDVADVDRFFAEAEAAVRSFAGAAEGLEGVLGGLGVAIGSQLLAQLPLIGGFLPTISPITGVLVGLVAGSEDARAAIGRLAKEFGGVVTDVGPKVLKALSTVADELGSGLGAALEAVGGAAADAARVLGPVFADGLEEIAPPLGDLVENIGELVAGLVDGLVPVLSGALGPAMSVAADLLGVAAGAVGLLAENTDLLIPALAGVIALKFGDTLLTWGRSAAGFASALADVPRAISNIAATQGVSKLEALGGVFRSSTSGVAGLGAGLASAYGPMVALTGAAVLGTLAFEKYAERKQRIADISADLREALKAEKEEFDNISAAGIRKTLEDNNALETLNKLDLSMEELLNTSVRYGDALSDLATDWEVAQVTGDSASETVQDFIRNSEGLPPAVQAIGDAVSELVLSGQITEDEASRFFYALQELADGTADSFRNAKAEFTNIAKEAANAGEITSGELERVLTLIREAKTPEELNAAFAVLNDLLGGTASAASEAADQIRRVIDAVNELTNADRNADAASRRLAEAVDRTAAAFAKNGAGINEATEAGRANASAIASQVEAAERLAEAQARLDTSGETSRATLQAQADALAGLRDMGFITAEEFQRLIDIYNLTPEAIETRVQLNVAEAEAQIQQVHDRLDEIPGNPETDPIKAEIRALLNQGDYDAALARLAALERERRVKVRLDLAQMRTDLDAIDRNFPWLGGITAPIRGGFGLAEGGLIPGVGNTDSVPAMLTPGEFVIPKDKVKDFGVGFFEAIRTGKLEGFAKGGLVTDRIAMAEGGLVEAPTGAASQTRGTDSSEVWLRAMVAELQNLRGDLAGAALGGTNTFNIDASGGTTERERGRALVRAVRRSLRS